LVQYRKKSLEEKKEEVKSLMNQMETEIASYFSSSDDLKNYLQFMSRFYQYSYRNSMLIQNQFYGAKAVGSYAFWKEKGFVVQKGEKGIKILMPNRTKPLFKDEDGNWVEIDKASPIQKKEIENGHLEKRDGRLYFSVGHVFDVSQTDAKAEDLPKIFPNKWLEGDVPNYVVMMEALNEIGIKIGVSIGEPLEELGTSKGAFFVALNHIGLNPRNGELQNIKTLLHELAHAKLHSIDHINKYSQEEREFQAEMTAFAVASYFNIDTREYSIKYLHSWTNGKELNDKESLLKEVHETSLEFIETIEDKLVKWKQNQLSEEKENEGKKDQNKVMAIRKKYIELER